MRKSTVLLMIFSVFVITSYGEDARNERVSSSIKPKSEIYKGDGLISIYTSTGIEFTIRHVEKAYIPNKVSFFDIWQIWEAYENINGERGQKIIQSGEWATAILLKTGFVGGSLHGFEKKRSVQFFLDGKSIDEQAMIPLSPFKTFTIIQVSDLYAFDSITEKIAQITKRWDFGRKSEIKFDQSVKWLKEQSIEAAYLTMLPVIRDNNGNYISEKATRNDVNEVIDISQMGDVGLIGSENKTNKANSMKVWGDVYSFAVKVDRHKRLPNSSMWLWAPKQYNKVYFDYCGEYDAKPGEEFKVSSVYKFTVN